MTATLADVSLNHYGPIGILILIATVLFARRDI